MTKTAVLFLAEGTEEMEFSITYDILVRGGVKARSVYVPAEGAPAAPPSGMVTASRGVKLGVDMTLADLQKQGLGEVDALIVPGGAGGANTMSKNPGVLRLLKEAYDQEKIVAMICAGSLAALEAQIGLNGAITSHPSVKEKLSSCTYDLSHPSVPVPGVQCGCGGTTRDQPWPRHHVCLCLDSGREADG